MVSVGKLLTSDGWAPCLGAFGTKSCGGGNKSGWVSPSCDESGCLCLLSGKCAELSISISRTSYGYSKNLCEIVWNLHITYAYPPYTSSISRIDYLSLLLCYVSHCHTNDQKAGLGMFSINNSFFPTVSSPCKDWICGHTPHRHCDG